MNPYQFRFDGSPEAKEAIRLINEKYPNGYTFCGEWGCLYNNFGESGDYRYETLTPAQFVARMKGERDVLHESDIVGRLGEIGKVVKVCNNGRVMVNFEVDVHISELKKLTLTDRIRHAYPSLSAEDVEQIVKMVRDEKDSN